MFYNGMLCGADNVGGIDNNTAVKKGRQTYENAFYTRPFRRVCGICGSDGVLKKESAYFTVEAAFILPMAILFTTVMIFMAFYSYDRCIIEQIAYEAAMRGTSNHFDNAQEAYEAANRAAARLTDGNLFALNHLTHSVSVTADSVVVSYDCKINMPLITWLGEYTDDLDFSFKVVREAKRIKQTQSIRMFRTIKGKGLRWKNDAENTG